jgi:hypothetical protein
MFGLRGMKKSRSFSPTQKKVESTKDLSPIAGGTGGGGGPFHQMEHPTASEEAIPDNASRDDDESTNKDPSLAVAGPSIVSTRKATRRGNSNNHVHCVEEHQDNRHHDVLAIEDELMTTSSSHRVDDAAPTTIASLIKEQEDLRNRIAKMSRMIQSEENEKALHQKSTSITLVKLFQHRNALHDHIQDLSCTCHTLDDKVHRLREGNNDMEKERYNSERTSTNLVDDNFFFDDSFMAELQEQEV